MRVLYAVQNSQRFSLWVPIEHDILIVTKKCAKKNSESKTPITSIHSVLLMRISSISYNLQCVQMFIFHILMSVLHIHIIKINRRE